MHYDQRFHHMRNWLFAGRDASPWTPIMLLNYFLHRRTAEYLDLRPTDQVLEVGCDRGHYMTVLRPRCQRVFGIDVNDAALADNPHPDVQRMDATALAFPSASFDRVVSMHTIEHIPDLQAALVEMARVLKPGGKMVHVYPWEPIRGYSAAPGALLAYGSLRAARELHLHKLDPRKLGELGVRAGLRPGPSRLLFTPFPFFPSYITVLSKDRDRDQIPARERAHPEPSSSPGAGGTAAAA
jgi:SAM-dependent methyltransferase